MTGHDQCHMKPVGLESPLRLAGGVGAGRYGQDACENPALLVQQPIHQGREERAEAVRVDHVAGGVVTCFDIIPDLHLVLLHSLDRRPVELPMSLVVAREGRIHQHHVEPGERKRHVAGAVHLFGVESVEAEQGPSERPGSGCRRRVGRRAG